MSGNPTLTVYCGPMFSAKTSRLLLDLERADSGEMLINGSNVAKSEDWKETTAAYLDEGFLISYLTPKEYFYFVGNLRRLSKATVDEFLQSQEVFFEPSNYNKYIRDLSKGTQYKTGILASLLWNPEVLILDEPFANLDPSSQLRLMAMLREANEAKKTTIVVSSHDLNHITDLCKRILLIDKGIIIKNMDASAGALTELENHFRI